MNDYYTENNVFRRPKCVIWMNRNIHFIYTGSKCMQHNWKQKVNNIFGKTWLHSVGWIRLIFFVYVLYGGLCILIDLIDSQPTKFEIFWKQIVVWAFCKSNELCSGYRSAYFVSNENAIRGVEHWTLNTDHLNDVFSYCAIIFNIRISLKRFGVLAA